MQPRRLLSVAFMLAFTTLSACDGGKGAAQTAMTAADSALAAVQAEAMKVAPDALKPVTDAMAGAKEAFAKGDYKAALTGAQDVASKVPALTSAIAAKKTELTTAWTAMSTALPATIDSIKTKVEALAKTKKLPAGLTAPAVDSLKTGLATATSAWTDAAAAYAKGDLAAAMAKASDVKTWAASAMARLAPPAAK